MKNLLATYLSKYLNTEPIVSACNGYEWWHLPELADMLYAKVGQNIDGMIEFLGTNDYNSGVPIGKWYQESIEQVPVARRGEQKQLKPLKKRTLIMDEGTLKGRINIGMKKLKTMWPTKMTKVMNA